MTRRGKAPSENSLLNQQSRRSPWARFVRAMWRALNAPVSVALLSAVAGSLLTLVVQTQTGEPTTGQPFTAGPETESATLPLDSASNPSIRDSNASSNPHSVKTQALVNINSLSDNNNWEIGTSLLDTATYKDSLRATMCTWANPATSQEYLLGRRYSRFRALVGIADDSKVGADMRFVVTGDGNTIFSQTVGIGKPKTIDIPIENVLRLMLTVEASPDASFCYNDATAVWAEASVQE
jgi:hypothetical protein